MELDNRPNPLWFWDAHYGEVYSPPLRRYLAITVASRFMRYSDANALEGEATAPGPFGTRY